MTQQPQPSFLVADPRYCVGDDGRSILLCDGERPVSAMLTHLTETQAVAFALHLNLALELGERKGLLLLAKGTTP